MHNIGMKILWTLLALLFAIAPAQAQFIDIRISVKLIDYGGNHNPSTEADFDAMLVEANRFMANQSRGYRFVKADFAVIQPNVPSPALFFSKTDGSPVPTPPPGQPNPPNTFKVQPDTLYQWWQTTPTPFVAANGVVISQYEKIRDNIFGQAILANKTAFDYRTTEANLYLVWPGFGGGVGSFPYNSHPDTNIYYVSGVSAERGAVALFVHEFGHYVDLQHPFVTTESVNKDALGTEIPDYSDTPPDVWAFDPEPNTLSSPANADLLGQKFYARNYALLNTVEQLEIRRMDAVGRLRNLGDPYSVAQVNELYSTWENIMSYHKGEDPVLDHWIFTKQQMDHLTDILSSIRRPIASGRTWFASPTGLATASSPNASQSPPFDDVVAPSLGKPYKLSTAIASASSTGSDIVLLKAGTYTDVATITKHVTFRVAPGSPATLRLP